MAGPGLGSGVGRRARLPLVLAARSGGAGAAVGDVAAAEPVAPARLVLRVPLELPDEVADLRLGGWGVLAPARGVGAVVRWGEPGGVDGVQRLLAHGLETRADERVRDGTDGRGRVRAGGCLPVRRDAGANFKDGGAVLTSNLCATICARSSALSTLTTL